MCENQKGKDKLKLQIPFWSEWGAWSHCSKSCKTYEPLGQPGIQRRTRNCEGHKGEHHTCKSNFGGGVETRACTGDKGKTDVFCPVPPKVSSWSKYGPCSPACGPGTRERSRTCKEGLFNENPVSNKCPTKGHVLFEKETEACTNGECSKDCKLSNWGNWEPCSPSCSEEDNFQGKKIRTRAVLAKATGNGTCGVTEDSMMCAVPTCPKDGVWSSRLKTGTCHSSKNCGEGKEEEERKCEGRKGTGKLCQTTNGYESEYEMRSVTCNTGVRCPDGVWSSWQKTSTCYSSKNCGKGKQEEERKCQGRKGAGKLCRTTIGYESEYEKRSVTCNTGVICTCGE